MDYLIFTMVARHVLEKTFEVFEDDNKIKIKMK